MIFVLKMMMVVLKMMIAVPKMMMFVLTMMIEHKRSINRTACIYNATDICVLSEQEEDQEGQQEKGANSLVFACFSTDFSCFLTDFSCFFY